MFEIVDFSTRPSRLGIDTSMPRRPAHLPLPASSPESNPMGLVWQYLRQNKLANRVFRDDRQIVEACCGAWNLFANDPGLVTSIPSRDWAQVNL